MYSANGPVFPAEYFVARFELRDIFANCFNRSRVIDTQSSVFWFAHPEYRTNQPRTADCEIERIDGEPREL